MPCTASTAASIFYVKRTASGTNTRTSWANAYTDLQSGPSNADCAEGWVAHDVHKPATADQTVSLAIKFNIALYGGFSGIETTRNARDPAAHIAHLSGDIDNNDIGRNHIDVKSDDIVGAHSRPIVVLDGAVADEPITAITVIDVFTMTGGDNNHNTNGRVVALDGYSDGASSARGCNYPTEAHIADARGAVRTDSTSTCTTHCKFDAVEANSLAGDLIFADGFGSHPWDDF